MQEFSDTYVAELTLLFKAPVLVTNDDNGPCLHMDENQYRLAHNQLQNIIAHDKL